MADIRSRSEVAQVSCKELTKNSRRWYLNYAQDCGGHGLME
jgi:hypothetical protein